MKKLFVAAVLAIMSFSANAQFYGGMAFDINFDWTQNRENSNIIDELTGATSTARLFSGKITGVLNSLVTSGWYGFKISMLRKF